MENAINQSLIITLIGMGLVFGAIFLLWGVMALLVKIAPGKGIFVLPKPSEEIQELARKRKAAIAAVSVAVYHLADTTQPHEFPEPPTAFVSAWQAVMRSKMLNKRGQIK